MTYPITFYDSTTDENGAAAIELAAGDREEADVALHAVRAVHLHVEIPARQGGGGFMVSLRRSVFGVQVSNESESFNVQEKSISRGFDVAPGTYEVEIGDPPRLQEVNAAADLELDASGGTPLESVSGKLVMTDGSPAPDFVNLSLTPVGGGNGEIERGVAHKGVFEIGVVPPGVWTLALAAQQQTLSVVAVATGGAPVAGDRVTVADRPVIVTAMVGRAKTRITGFARKGGKGFAGAMIVLVSREPGAYQALLRRDQSDSDGSFSLRDVPAGRYTVVAIEDGWKLDWRDRSAIARYLPGGVGVTVNAQSAAAVKLEKDVAVE